MSEPIKEREKIPALSEYESQRSEHLSIATTAHKMANDLLTDAQYVDASEFLIKIKEKRRMWEKLITPAIQAAKEAHNRMLAVKKELDQPLERAENEILKPALLRYSDRKAAERKAAEEQMNRMLADEAIKNQVGELSSPLPSPVVVLPKVEEPKGISYVTTFSAEVVDFKALLKAVLDGTVPEDAIQPNMSFINQRARSLKTLMSWPGVEVKEKRSTRVTIGG